MLLLWENLKPHLTRASLGSRQSSCKCHPNQFRFCRAHSRAKHKTHRQTTSCVTRTAVVWCTWRGQQPTKWEVQISFSALTLLLGDRKIIRPVKNWVMRCWRGYLSGVRCKWLAYGLADANATLSSLLQKIQNGLSFWYRPTQVLLEKKPLNDCVCW